MVKQLSPVIRADGYHILADATGVPDLYAHMGPTLKRLLPGHRREPSALTGRARALVTVWVLIVVPVLLALSLSAIILLPRLATSAWDSGRHIIMSIPHQAGHGHILAMLASLVSLVALVLPVAGSVLVTQKILRTVDRQGAGLEPERSAAPRTGARGGRGRGRRRRVGLVAVGPVPAGPSQPERDHRRDGAARVRAGRGGSTRLRARSTVVAHARQASGGGDDPGRRGDQGASGGVHHPRQERQAGGGDHQQLDARPEEGRRRDVHLRGRRRRRPASTPSTTGGTTTTTTTTTPSAPPAGSSSSPDERHRVPVQAARRAWTRAARRRWPTNTTNGGVTYDVAYALVTVTGGAPVTNTNSAYAIAQLQRLHDRGGVLPGRPGRGSEQPDRADQRRRRAQLQLPRLHHHRDRRPDRGDAEVAAVQGAAGEADRGPSAAERAAQPRRRRHADGRRRPGGRRPAADRQPARGSGIEANPPKATSTTTTPSGAPATSGQGSSSSTSSSGTSSPSSSSTSGTSSGTGSSSTLLIGAVWVIDDHDAVRHDHHVDVDRRLADDHHHDDYYDRVIRLARAIAPSTPARSPSSGETR